MAVPLTCLVGAGSIAETHAEAIKDLGCARIVAVVDPVAARGEAFARKWRIPNTFDSVENALSAGGFDVVHVLTPPDTHVRLTRDLLQAGRHVLVEKPVSETAEDGRMLAAMARERKVTAAVNQNFIHHPALLKLRAALSQNRAGPVRSLHVAYNVPLRQLAAQQFGHWMFRKPKNILLEQAVHPLSQMLAIDPELDLLSAAAPGGIDISPEARLFPALDALFRSPRMTAQLQFAVGRNFPHWQISAICDDGVLVADILANRFFAWQRARWLEPVDAAVSGLRTSARIAAATARNAADFALTLAKLKKRSDPFYVSMRASIGHFYAAVAAESAADGVTQLDAGAKLVAICEAAAAQAFSEAKSTPAPRPAPTLSCDVAVLGGTGFIGVATVKELLRAGHSVRVMARNTVNLNGVFWDPGVHVVRGDVTRPDDVAKAIEGSKYVINLAHGGASGSWAAIEAALVGSARQVAAACIKAGVERLIHVGSIAGLYAGGDGDVITGATPPDPQSERRSDYARAKAIADHMLMHLHQTQNLPVCIVRPGLVVGAGTSPFHSGLGMFNNEQHCLGWNRGLNPLPFVLVADVAKAIVAALTAPAAIGRAYNLVGDARPTAREYIEELARVTRRPLMFCPALTVANFGEELFKWAIKRATGRKVPGPSLRDFKSRGLAATFDCADAKRDLNWSPVGDRAAFYEAAFAGLSA